MVVVVAFQDEHRHHTRLVTFPTTSRQVLLLQLLLRLAVITIIIRTVLILNMIIKILSNRVDIHWDHHGMAVLPLVVVDVARLPKVAATHHPPSHPAEIP